MLQVSGYVLITKITTGYLSCASVCLLAVGLNVSPFSYIINAKKKKEGHFSKNVILISLVITKYNFIFKRKTFIAKRDF